jgi:hypothetical protein
MLVRCMHWVLGIDYDKPMFRKAGIILFGGD